MADQEQTMYQILGALSAMGAPFVFKGALITKLVLSENGFVSTERQTKDIDADWVGEPPSMPSLVDTVNQALEAFDGKFLAIATREYTETQTAGLSIIGTATGKEVVAMDIGIRPVIGSRVYYYGEIGIWGVLPTEILADKIAVLSGRYIFRRTKDLFDVYALAHCVRVATSEIYDVQKIKGRSLSDFTEFCTRRQDVEHAYARLRGIEGKPDFDAVYAYLTGFLSPFIQRDEAPRLWSPGTTEWESVPQKNLEKSSVLKQIRDAKKTRRENLPPSPKKSTSKDEPEL